MKGYARIISLTVALLMVVLVVLTGCGSSAEKVSAEPAKAAESAKAAEPAKAADNGSSPFKAGADEQYYMVTFFSGGEYWKGCFKGFEDASKLYGAKVVYTGANQGDVNQEVTVLEQVISKKPAGIAVTCVNPDGLAIPIKKAMEQGIPVVTFDADSPASGRYSFLATGNYQAGVIAARTIAKLVGEEGEVGMIQVPGLLNLEQRGQGFKETIAKEFPKMKVVQTVNGKLDQAEGAKVTAGMLQAYPNLKGIFASDSTAGVGAGTAIKEAKKAGEIKVVSFDTDKGTLDMIKEGVLHASIAQGTYNMGFWGFNYIYFLKHNLINPIDGWKEKGVNPLPPYVDTGVSVVTKENVDAFYTK